MEIWFILLKMLGPQRAGWMWAEFTTKLGWMGCLCSVTSPSSKHLEQNESYFHNLHMNWVWMGYVTSVELFMDLKPRIYEVCPTIYQLLPENNFHGQESLMHKCVRLTSHIFRVISKSIVMQNETSQNVILYIMIYFSKIRTK